MASDIIAAAWRAEVAAGRGDLVDAARTACDAVGWTARNYFVERDGDRYLVAWTHEQYNLCDTAARASARALNASIGFYGDRGLADAYIAAGPVANAAALDAMWEVNSDMARAALLIAYMPPDLFDTATGVRRLIRTAINDAGAMCSTWEVILYLVIVQVSWTQHTNHAHVAANLQRMRDVVSRAAVAQRHLADFAWYAGTSAFFGISDDDGMTTGRTATLGYALSHVSSDAVCVAACSIVRAVAERMREVGDDVSLASITSCADELMLDMVFGCLDAYRRTAEVARQFLVHMASDAMFGSWTHTPGRGYLPSPVRTLQFRDKLAQRIHEEMSHADQEEAVLTRTAVVRTLVDHILCAGVFDPMRDPDDAGVAVDVTGVDDPLMAAIDDAIAVARPLQQWRWRQSLRVDDGPAREQDLTRRMHDIHTNASDVDGQRVYVDRVLDQVYALIGDGAGDNGAAMARFTEWLLADREAEATRLATTPAWDVAPPAPHLLPTNNLALALIDVDATAVEPVRQQQLRTVADASDVRGIAAALDDLHTVRAAADGRGFPLDLHACSSTLSDHSSRVHKTAMTSVRRSMRSPSRATPCARTRHASPRRSPHVGSTLRRVRGARVRDASQA
jgi:hypothetical protein